jgi:hypothetical protein
VEKVQPVHKKQLLTYLRLADRRLGLLINFGEELIKDGITRIANQMLDNDPSVAGEAVERRRIGCDELGMVDGREFG